MKTKKQRLAELELQNLELSTRIKRLENPPIVFLYQEIPVHFAQSQDGYNMTVTAERAGMAIVIEIKQIDEKDSLACVQNWYKLLITDAAQIKEEYWVGEKELAKGIKKAAAK